MAIQYIGSIISGIASDTKPTPSANEKGVLFIETDTNKVYQWDTDSWNEVTSNAANLSGTTLNSNIVTSSLTTVGALNAGSITSGFTSIDVGSGGITTTGTVTAGDLNVTGTTTTIDSTNTTIADRLIELANGASSSTADAGIIVERGSTGDNAVIAWDESADTWTLGTTTATGSSTGDLTITAGTLAANLSGDITSTGAVNITPAAGSAIVLDGTINIDAGVVTGATSITSGTVVVPEGQLTLGSTAVTSTAAEINTLDALSRGSILYGNASAATTVLTKGTAGTVLTSDGTDISWAEASGGGGGSVTLEVASGQTITPGMAVGVDSTGKVIPFTQAGADYTAITEYRPAADIAAGKYIKNMQIAYDTETDLHVAIYTKHTSTATGFIAEGANIYAVAFSVDANDVITWGTERTISTSQVLYDRMCIGYCATKNQVVAAWLGDSSKLELRLLKPVAGSPPTINASTELEVSSNMYSEPPHIADCSDGSDHRILISFCSTNYRAAARIITFGTWDESHGGAHNLTLGTQYDLNSTANYYMGTAAWSRGTKSSNSGKQLIAYYYSGIYGYDIGTSGGTINTITFRSHSISNRGPGRMIWAGTNAETHLYQDHSGSTDHVIRYNISAADNTVTEGAYANGKLQIGSSSNGQHGTELIYYGTQDKMVAIHKRNYGSFNYAYGPPGSTWYIVNYTEFFHLYMWDGGDGGDRMYGGGTGGAYDTYDSYLKITPMQGNFMHSAHTCSMSGVYNPDRNRILVAQNYSGWTAEKTLPLDGSYPSLAAGIWMIKTDTGMDDHGSVPKFLGFSNASSNVTAGNDVEVSVTSGTNSQQSGLTIGAQYFLDSFGILSPYGPQPVSRANILAGTAISATELVVIGQDAPASYYGME